LGYSMHPSGSSEKGGNSFEREEQRKERRKRREWKDQKLKPAFRPVSLVRALSKMGFASRREGKGVVESGRVRVNGSIVTDPAFWVFMERDRILVDGNRVRQAAREYIALNKPRGLVTTARDEQGRETVYECLRGAGASRLIPVGRLDKASEGLLFFTTDTAWAQSILDPVGRLPKVYQVQVGRHLGEQDLERLCSGVELGDGTRVKAADAKILRRGKVNCWVEITLHGGVNRQIRRMMTLLEAEVLRLVRVAIGPVKLGDLPKGHFRRARPLIASEGIGQEYFINFFRMI